MPSDFSLNRSVQHVTSPAANSGQEGLNLQFQKGISAHWGTSGFTYTWGGKLSWNSGISKVFKINVLIYLIPICFTHFIGDWSIWTASARCQGKCLRQIPRLVDFSSSKITGNRLKNPSALLDQIQILIPLILWNFMGYATKSCTAHSPKANDVHMR